MVESTTKLKTYKREVACGMLLFLAALFGVGIYEEPAMQAAEFLTLPVFTFSSGAFAIDAVFKQGGKSREVR